MKSTHIVQHGSPFAAFALWGGTWFRCAPCGRATLAARAADRSAFDRARLRGWGSEVALHFLRRSVGLSEGDHGW